MKLSPIALFVYNRSWHTQKTIEALQKNTLASESDLIVFSDGPKDNDLSRRQVSEVRKCLVDIKGFKSVSVIEKRKNYGLAESIITGVSDVIQRYGKVIVLEDDLVTSCYFLEYMNQGLDLYKNNNKVISIHGYIYPVKERLPETYFLKGADCWGWATWKRGWDLFEFDGKKLLSELILKNLTREFDFYDTYPYTKMLKEQVFGKNNSWAIRWYASAFLKNKLTLYPRESLVYNIGLDGTGTNSELGERFNRVEEKENIKIAVKNIEIKENMSVRLIVSNYFRIKKYWVNKLIQKIRKIFQYGF